MPGPDDKEDLAKLAAVPKVKRIPNPGINMKSGWRQLYGAKGKKAKPVFVEPPPTRRDLRQPAIPFSEMKPMRCFWPIGKVGAPGFGFCGDRVYPGSPYCIHHRQRSLAGSPAVKPQDSPSAASLGEDSQPGEEAAQTQKIPRHRSTGGPG